MELGRRITSVDRGVQRNIIALHILELLSQVEKLGAEKSPIIAIT